MLGFYEDITQSVLAMAMLLDAYTFANHTGTKQAWFPKSRQRPRKQGGHDLVLMLLLMQAC